MLKLYNFTKWILLIILLLIKNPLYSQEFKSRVKIDFEKSLKVKINKAINIDIKFEALEELKNVDIDISLPSEVSLHEGKIKQKFNEMSKKEKYKLSLKFSINESIKNRITVKVISEKDGRKHTDYADLFLISYDNEVELLNQMEASDQSQRFWKAIKLDKNISVVPISYEAEFIQLEAEERVYQDSVGYDIDNDMPFILRGKDGKSGSSTDNNTKLSKLAKTSSISVTVSGYVLFLDSNSNWRPFVNSTVEIWEDDNLFDDYLGSTTTNSNGYFLKNVSGSDGWFDDNIEVYLQLKAKNSKVAVYEPISAEPHRWFTNTITTSGGSINFGNIGIAVGSYGACTIFHRLNESWNFTASHGYDPGFIAALFPNSNGTYYSFQTFPWTSYGAIYIQHNHWGWDAEDIPRHEYGHALMHHAQDKWWPSNSGGSHGFYDVLHPNFAWTEGWATAYAQFVDTDGKYNANGWNFKIENQIGLGLPEGHTNEARVAAAVSDLYDSNSDGEDQVSINYSKIINALRNHNNDDFIDFWDNLKTSISSDVTKYYASKAIRYNTIDIPLEAPPAPSNLSANAVSTDRIDLSWTDNSSDEDGFKIERKTGSSGSWGQIASVNTNTTSYIDNDEFLEGGTTYYYRVKAFRGSTYSGYSNTANATTSWEAKITGPSYLGWKETGTWTANPSGGSYEWRRRYNGTGAWSYVLSSNQTYTSGMLDTDFELQLKVVRDGRTEYDTHYVYYSDEPLPKQKSETTAEFIMPTKFKIAQNYPNPFNPKTEIIYQLPEESFVTLNIYNIAGIKVRTLVRNHQIAGYYSVLWDAKNNSGSPLPSGVYFYEFKAGKFREVKRLTLLK